VNTTVRDRWTAVRSHPTTSMLVVLLGILLCFSLLSPEAFPTPGNARSILSDAAILLVVAIGATYVIITAGIDLSVGSVLVFSSVVGAQTMERLGTGPVAIGLGLLVSVLAGAAWGALNGILVAKAQVPAFVVTLGTLGAAYGAALILTDGVDVRAVPPALVEFGSGRVLGIPTLVLTAAAVAIVAGLALSATVFGRHTYAIGANPESARRAGINVERHLIAVYAVAGLLAGLAGFMSLARYGTTTIAGQATVNLQAITAVVIGGTSLFGGSGWVLGTAIGVFIPIVLRNGFIVQGVAPYWQYIAVGSVLILAVYVDQRRRSRRLG